MCLSESHLTSGVPVHPEITQWVMHVHYFNSACVFKGLRTRGADGLVQCAMYIFLGSHTVIENGIFIM